MTVAHADISEPTDRIGSFPRKAVAASAIGYAMDGFDLLILGFMLRAISAELHLTPPQAGSLITWTLIGAVAGGILFGTLSDYYGRVRVLTWTILLFAVFTGLGALAQGYWDLLIYRTIAGLGLGGEFGIGMTLVAEAWPAKYRARGCTYVALGWQAGVLVAALITPILLPIIGWRGMFVAGLVPGLVAFAVRLYVPEPQIFLDRAKERRTGMPLGLLVKDTATRNISLGMLILCSVQNFGYYGLMIWLPSYLSTRFGYTLTQSALWTAVTVLGMAFGILVFGQFCRQGRPPSGAVHLPGRRLHHGAGLFAANRRDGSAHRRRDHGYIRQWHAWRLWRAALRALSDRGAGNRGERHLQSRPRRRRLRSVRGRGPGGELFLHCRDRAFGDDLSVGYSRDCLPDPREKRRAS
jgi:MFS family permease